MCLGTYAPPPRAGIGGGSFGGTAFEDEPPLLEGAKKKGKKRENKNNNNCQCVNRRPECGSEENLSSCVYGGGWEVSCIPGWTCKCTHRR